MRVEGIDHIAIASPDPARLRWFFSTALQLKLLGEESVPAQLVDTTIWSPMSVASPRLELLIPSSPDSVVAKFLAQRGGGVHHLAFQVRDIEQAVRELRHKGVRFVSDKPQTGVADSSIIFIHPHSTGGVLVELVQRK